MKSLEKIKLVLAMVEDVRIEAARLGDAGFFALGAVMDATEALEDETAEDLILELEKTKQEALSDYKALKAVSAEINQAIDKFVNVMVPGVKDYEAARRELVACS